MELVEHEGGQRLCVGMDLEHEKEDIWQQLNAANELVRTLNKRAEELTEISRIVKLLPVSWSDSYPGKARPHYSFLDDSGNQAVVEELIPEGVEQFKGDIKAWYGQRRSLYGKYDEIPPNLKIVPFVQVSTAPCPNCGCDQPLVKEYYQTYDSPDGDTWRTRILQVCCEKVHVIDSVTDEI